MIKEKTRDVTGKDILKFAISVTLLVTTLIWINQIWLAPQSTQTTTTIYRTGETITTATVTKTIRVSDAPIVTEYARGGMKITEYADGSQIAIPIDPKIGVKVVTNYSWNGLRTIRFENGTQIQRYDAGIYRNQSISAWSEYRGIATLRYPAKPVPNKEYKPIDDDGRTSDMIVILSLVDSIRREPQKYNISYTRFLDNSTHIEIENLHASQLKSSRLFRNFTVTAIYEVSAKLIKVDILNQWYEIKELKVVGGGKSIRGVIQWNWLLLEKRN